MQLSHKKENDRREKRFGRKKCNLLTPLIKNVLPHYHQNKSRTVYFIKSVDVSDLITKSILNKIQEIKQVNFIPVY